jgi:hypothetical protein
MENARKTKIVEIDRGLFLVRYATAEDQMQPPTIAVAPHAASEKNISFILHPDHDRALLFQPGRCLVVRATAPGKLLIDVAPLQEGGSAAATIRIEALNQGKASSFVEREKTRNGLQRDFRDFRVRGHIANIGDVIVNANEWLAGPAAPSRIEGISIEWPGKPQDINIRYSVKTARAQAISDRQMELGSFAGTRGKALPIVGITLEIFGPAAANFQLSAEAIFLGSPVARATGDRLVLSGPTGREPLVGLRIGAEELEMAAATLSKPSANRPARPPSRVRVFRSHTVQDRQAAV